MAGDGALDEPWRVVSLDEPWRVVSLDEPWRVVSLDEAWRVVSLDEAWRVVELTGGVSVVGSVAETASADRGGASLRAEDTDVIADGMGAPVPEVAAASVEVPRSWTVLR